VVVEGLAYQDDFVTPEEERELLELIEPLDFREIEMRGQTAKRTVRHFGLGYDYDRAELAQVLVSRYPEGAGIGWHRDAPMFGSRIVGVSLAAPARMRFQRTVQGEREVAAIELPPRSAYVLSGKARWSWQHSIPPAKALRYSVTFRTLKRSQGGR
jgi:alkylated DNA repair protein (DNA oxidative demethylase)